MPNKNWLIWDGDCTFCGNAASWFQQQDTEHIFTVIPAQTCPAPPMTPELLKISRQSVIVITDKGECITGGSAVLYALQRVGWKPSLMRLLRKPPFVWAVNAGYRIVANNRQLFSRIFFRD